METTANNTSVMNNGAAENLSNETQPSYLVSSLQHQLPFWYEQQLNLSSVNNNTIVQVNNSRNTGSLQK